MGEPRLPYRARPLQVLLGVGGVLVVSAAGAVAGGSGGVAARLPLFLLAVVAAGFSLVAGLDGLRSTEETLAACAGGLAVVASALGGTLRAGSAVPLGAVAAGCVVLHRLSPATAAWPLTAWVALQLAVLRAVEALPGTLHPSLFLAVALVGLAVALCGRRPVARIALLTAVPWWVTGVLGGLGTAWAGEGLPRQVAALLVVAAAIGLLPARLRADLDPLLGPPAAVPLVAGGVAGAALSGSLAALGTAGIAAAGYVGVLVATTVPEYLSGWRRGAVPAGRLGRGLGPGAGRPGDRRRAARRRRPERACPRRLLRRPPRPAPLGRLDHVGRDPDRCGGELIAAR